MPETVSISIKRLRQLVADSLELDALNAAGVDNWQGRDEVEWPTDLEIDEYVSSIVAMNNEIACANSQRAATQ